MGVLDFLFGRRTSSGVVLPDRIWLTQQAKWNGLRSAVADFSQSDAVALILIAHFDETLEQVRELADGYLGEGTVAAMLGEELKVDLAAKLQLDAESTLDLIIAERHPLWSKDEQLEQFAAALPCRARVTHYVSLQDTLMARFAGARLTEVLRHLNMQEDETIESAIVQRQIEKAQRKVESRAFGDIRAPSAEEWWQKNMPAG
jgi:preprotein translocase subunit SecA